MNAGTQPEQVAHEPKKEEGIGWASFTWRGNRVTYTYPRFLSGFTDPTGVEVKCARHMDCRKTAAFSTWRGGQHALRFVKYWLLSHEKKDGEKPKPLKSITVDSLPTVEQLDKMQFKFKELKVEASEQGHSKKRKLEKSG